MESFKFDVDGASIKNMGGFNLPTARSKDQVSYDQQANMTRAWGLSMENDVETILNQREGMLERMRLESDAARESAATRQARREVEELKKQVETLTLEVAARPTQAQFQQQQHIVACLEDQVESQQAMLELAASNSIDSLAAASLAEKQVKQLRVEAEAAQCRAVLENQRVAEIEARLEVMALAHTSQIETMQKKSSALITNFIQPKKQHDGDVTGAIGASPGPEGDDEVTKAVNKLLLGLFSGEVSEEDAAKQLVALNCELEVLAPPAPSSGVVTEDQAAVGAGGKSSEAGEAHTTDTSASAPSNAATPASATAARATANTAPSSLFGPMGGADSNFIMSDPTKLMRLIERASVMRQEQRGMMGAPSLMASKRASEGGGEGPSGGAPSASMPAARQATSQGGVGSTTPQSGATSSADPNAAASSSWSVRLRSLGSALSGGGAASTATAQPTNLQVKSLSDAGGEVTPPASKPGLQGEGRKSVGRSRIPTIKSQIAPGGALTNGGGAPINGVQGAVPKRKSFQLPSSLWEAASTNSSEGAVPLPLSRKDPLKAMSREKWATTSPSTLTRPTSTQSLSSHISRRSSVSTCWSQLDSSSFVSHTRSSLEEASLGTPDRHDTAPVVFVVLEEETQILSLLFDSNSYEADSAIGYREPGTVGYMD
eukprot:gene15424-21506_t